MNTIGRLKPITDLFDADMDDEAKEELRDKGYKLVAVAAHDAKSELADAKDHLLVCDDGTVYLVAGAYGRGENGYIFLREYKDGQTSRQIYRITFSEYARRLESEENGWALSSSKVRVEEPEEVVEPNREGYTTDLSKVGKDDELMLITASDARGLTPGRSYKVVHSDSSRLVIRDNNGQSFDVVRSNKRGRWETKDK